MNYVGEKGIGIWPNVTFNNLYGTVFPAIELSDEFRDWYGLDILEAPSYFDGFNPKLSITYALGCKKGCIIHSRHDLSRDP